MSGARALPGLLRPALMLGGLVAAGLALRLLPAGGPAALLGGGGGAPHAAMLLLAGAALCAVGVPRQVVCYAAGLAFGAAPGAALALLAQGLGCAAGFAWARLLGRRYVASRLGGRLARLDGALAARPFAATLALRLLPVGNNLLLTLAGGVSSVAAAPFLAASVLGYLPQTLVFGFAGAGTRVGHGPELALAAGLFVASAALGLLLWRRAPVSAAGASGRAPEAG